MTLIYQTVRCNNCGKYRVIEINNPHKCQCAEKPEFTCSDCGGEIIMTDEELETYQGEPLYCEECLNFHD